MKRVTGPIGGFLIASDTAKGANGYLGMARICPAGVADVWDCEPADRARAGPVASEAQALDLVEQEARAIVLRLVVRELACHALT
jgi:hypothetical protein